MDFFEKAHIVPKSDSLTKVNKSDEIKKKQLKQMLYGYKQSDNEMIRNSANKIDDIIEAQKRHDDSQSVSGFSDLDLTFSSNDNDVTPKTVTSLTTEENIETLALESSEIRFEENTEKDKEIHTSSEATQTLLPESTQSSVCSEDTNDSLSDIIEEISSDNNSTVSEPFDVDGALADRIYQRLGVTQKRKITSDDKETNRVVKKKIDEQSDDIEEETEGVDCLDYKESTPSPMSDMMNQSTFSDSSLPFVSIVASNLPDESFSDILGDYRHSTVKNISIERQLKTDFTDYCEFFKDAKVEDCFYFGNKDFIQRGIESTAKENDEQKIVHDMEAEISEEANMAKHVNIYYTKNKCIIVLKYPVKLYILGKVSAQLLTGAVSVFGHTLDENFVDIYATYCHYALPLVTHETKSSNINLSGKLINHGIMPPIAETITNTLEENDSVICLRRLNNRKIDFVCDNFNSIPLFPKPSESNGYFSKASNLLGSTLSVTEPKRFFEERLHWESCVNLERSRYNRGVICGSKGTGKSTFLRYHVNKLLVNGPVLVIDLDPGQAEFTMPGNISATVINKPLLGPNFTHLQMPDKMLNIGLINTMDNPMRYVNAVKILMSYCHTNETYRSMPWIVNTMGMCNNMGLKFITLIIVLCEPTFVIQLDSANAKKRFDMKLTAQNVKQLFNSSCINDYMYYSLRCNPSQLEYSFNICRPEIKHAQKNFSLTPRDARYLTVLAYFGDLLDTNGVGLLDIVPYEVNLKDLNIGLNVKVSKQAVTNVINGKIVALCELPTQDKGTMFTLQDKPLPCLGFGLVRAVDFEAGILFVVTPAAGGRLQRANAILYADWMPEMRAGALPRGTPLPYRTTTHYQQRQLVASPRRRFNPIQLFKMSRNS